MNIQTGQEENQIETDEEFALGLAHLKAFVAREGHAQVPPEHVEPGITATEHTPGPWRATGPNVRADTSEGDGALVATVANHWANQTTSDTEKEANARLTAAAPGGLRRWY